MKEKQETYNGYTNRSTWLAKLHIDNTNEEVYKQGIELAKKYKEMVDYWDTLKRIDSTSYSYPFHQHKAVENMLKNILKQTDIAKEENYRFREIDLKQLCEALTE